MVARRWREREMLLKAWVEIDDRGREYLERAGTGVVSAVVPVGVADPEGGHALTRVEIQCDPPRGPDRAIRYSAHPVVGQGPMPEAALGAQGTGARVSWTVHWHRHDWIPAGLPISALNLGTDARCILVSLVPVLAPTTESVAALATDMR